MKVQKPSIYWERIVFSVLLGTVFFMISSYIIKDYIPIEISIPVSLIFSYVLGYVIISSLIGHQGSHFTASGMEKKQ